MSQSDAGKTDKVANNFRTPQWENSKLWKKKAKNQRIFEENKDKIEVQTDPTKCALGKWLGSEQARNAYDTGTAQFKQAFVSAVATPMRL